MRQRHCLLLIVTGLFILALLSGCGTSQAPAEKPAPPAVSNEPPPAPPPSASKTESVPAQTPGEQKISSPPPAENPPPSGTFAVQLGAYKQRESADRIASLAKDRYNRPVSVTYDNTAGLYKVSIGSFSSKDDARRFRDTMVQQFPTDYTDAWVSEIPAK